MIIGSIIEVDWNSSGAQTTTTNGASSVVFYTQTDADTWARLQSDQVIYGTANYSTSCLIVVVNTDTEQRRWWYQGIEYTA
jgi:hypothetical protein